MEDADFTPASPGRLVPTVEGVKAFVPNPLPREVSLSGSTIRLLTLAEHALGELHGVTGRLVDPYLIGSPLLRREAILSSRIEGTIATAEQMVMFEAGNPSPDEHQDDSTREVVNYIQAMQLGLKLLPNLPVCLRLICQIHERLLAGVRGEDQRPGEFRRAQNYIGRANEGIKSARFVPPPVPEMQEALSELDKYLNVEPPTVRLDHTADPDGSLAPLLVRLAFIHYQFETIHPFRDGNGRVGRVLIPLVLISHGRLREPLLYMSSYFEQHRTAYNDHMLRVSQTGDWEGWLKFFLRGVAESAYESIDLAAGLLALRDEWRGRFQSRRSSALLLKLIDHLFCEPFITIKTASDLMGVSAAAASANITKLAGAGILTERTGRKWGQVFVPLEILLFVDNVRRGVKPKPVTLVDQ